MKNYNIKNEKIMKNKELLLETGDRNHNFLKVYIRFLRKLIIK